MKIPDKVDRFSLTSVSFRHVTHVKWGHVRYLKIWKQVRRVKKWGYVRHIKMWGHIRHVKNGRHVRRKGTKAHRHVK